MTNDEKDIKAQERQRRTENMVLLIVFIVLAGGGAWLLATMADVRKTQDCVAQGRRNCAPIELPERTP